MIFWTPKITCVIVDAKNAREEVGYKMPCGRPSLRIISCTHIKLQKKTHVLWVKMKHALGLRCDDELACHMLACLFKYDRCRICFGHAFIAKLKVIFNLFE